MDKKQTKKSGMGEPLLLEQLVQRAKRSEEKHREGREKDVEERAREGWMDGGRDGGWVWAR